MAKIHVIPECYADKVFVNLLLKELIDFSHHAGGIHEVAKSLKMRDVAGYVNIGFVDKDKQNTPIYFDEFNLVDELDKCVQFKKHPDSRDYLIIIVPAIEKFYLRQLALLGKLPEHFNLPNGLKLFCKKLKKIEVEKNADFIRMVEFLIANKTPEIKFIYDKVLKLSKMKLK